MTLNWKNVIEWSGDTVKGNEKNIISQTCNYKLLEGYPCNVKYVMILNEVLHHTENFKRYMKQIATSSLIISLMYLVRNTYVFYTNIWDLIYINMSAFDF